MIRRALSATLNNAIRSTNLNKNGVSYRYYGNSNFYKVIQLF